MNNIEKWNKNIIIKDLIYKKNFKHTYSFPCIDNICLKMNNKKTIQNSQNIFFSFAILQILTNQKPKVCFAKKSVANFKVQKKMPLSCRMTLRRNLKYSFLQLFLYFMYPRLQLQLKKNERSLNIGIKNLLFIPQLAIINNFSLNDFGFNISFNFTTQDVELFLSAFQIKQENEKTKN